MQNKSAQTFKPNVMKLSETSFPLTLDQPVNLRIMLHAASTSHHQMSSSRLRKVIIKTLVSALQTLSIKRQFITQMIFRRVNRGVIHHPRTPCCSMMTLASCRRWRPVRRASEGAANREAHFLWSGRPVKRWSDL